MRTVWILMLVSVIFLSLSAAAASADAAARRRRQRPGAPPTPNTQPERNDASPSAKSKSKPAPAKGKAKGNAPGQSVEQQIAAAKASIRRYRRASADAVKRAQLSGTMIFMPAGVPAGAAVDYTSKHAGKTVRGKVKATGSGTKTSATITASRAR